MWDWYDEGKKNVVYIDMLMSFAGLVEESLDLGEES